MSRSRSPPPSPPSPGALKAKAATRAAARAGLAGELLCSLGCYTWAAQSALASSQTLAAYLRVLILGVGAGTSAVSGLLQGIALMLLP